METTEKLSTHVEKMKVSLLVDWVSADKEDPEVAKSLAKQKLLIENFCRNISDL